MKAPLTVWARKPRDGEYHRMPWPNGETAPHYTFTRDEAEARGHQPCVLCFDAFARAGDTESAGGQS